MSAEQGAPRSAALAALVALALAMAASAQAMVVVQRNFPDLVARAEQIVVGTVTEITEERDASGSPWTLVTFSDLTVLKGDVGTGLTLRFYGGRTGETAVHIPDMPSFTLGERNVVFVTGNGQIICPLVGVWQGRFRVRFDAAQGTEVVESSDGNPPTIRRDAAPTRAPALVAPVTLDEFRQSVADEIAHPRAGAARE